MSITLTRYLEYVPAEQKAFAERAFARGSTEAESIVRECRELPQELKIKLANAIASTRA